MCCLNACNAVKRSHSFGPTTDAPTSYCFSDAVNAPGSAYFGGSNTILLSSHALRTYGEPDFVSVE